MRERESEKERKREGERERESVHARVRVWEREGFAIAMVGLILSGIRFTRYCIELVFWKRTNSSLVIRVCDLDAANLRPALEHGCGKQTPSTSILFSRTNLEYVPSVKM